jgi:ketosteroid isomerase-like protein
MKTLSSIRHTWTLLWVFVVLIAPAVSAANNAAAEIRAVMRAQVAAWNRGDIDGFMDGYARAAETEFVSGAKITRGWQTVRDNYRKKYDSREKMGILKFSKITVTPLSSEAATVRGRWQLVRHKDKPQGTFTLLFRRTPVGWRIVRDHTL